MRQPLLRDDDRQQGYSSTHHGPLEQFIELERSIAPVIRTRRSWTELLSQCCYHDVATTEEGFPQVISYDTTRLTEFGIFGSIHGTVFASRFTWLQSAILIGIWLAVIVYSNMLDKTWFSTDLAAKVSNLSFAINSLVTFLLTFFVMATLNRWWSLRDECLGRLLTASNTLSFLSLAFEGEGATALQQKLLRYSLLSQALLFKEARKDTSLADLSTSRILCGQTEYPLLSQTEAQKLQQVRQSRAEAVWVWTFLLLLNNRVVPDALVGDVITCCKDARAAIQRTNMYLDTQLPIAYVHIICLMTKFDMVVIALQSGYLSAYGIQNGEWFYAFAYTAFLLVIPLMLQAILDLHKKLRNPFAVQSLGFPERQIRQQAQDQCGDFFRMRDAHLRSSGSGGGAAGGSSSSSGAGRT